MVGLKGKKGLMVQSKRCLFVGVGKLYQGHYLRQRSTFGKEKQRQWPKGGSVFKIEER